MSSIVALLARVRWATHPSGLSYFASRFLSSGLSRFIRADSLAAAMPDEWLKMPQKLNIYSYVCNNPLRFVDPTGMDREKSSQGNRVLVMYGESQFQDFAKNTGNSSRAAFEKSLKASYGDEAGAGAQIDVKRLQLKQKGDLDKVFKDSSYDVVIYTGHGASNAKQLLPGGVPITPKDLQTALAGAKSMPKNMYFYGCNTAASGFARVTSDLLPDTAITGTGNKVAPYYGWDNGPKGARANFRIVEDRDHNITFNRGNETSDVRKVDPKDLANAGLPR